MELPELKQGLQDIQQANVPPDIIATEEAPWLNMENLMQGYGNWFDNDKGLGEMLLGQLRAHGVDTQAATEAMLRELLQGLVDDLNLLQYKLTGFTTAITQQMQQTQAVADSVQAAIESQQPNPLATQIEPIDNTGMPQMNDVPVEPAPMSEPVPEPATAATQGPMPEPVSEPVPEPAPAAQEPAHEPAPEPAQGTMSDARMKYVLSDAAMKRIKQKVKNKTHTNMNNNILAACQGGF